MKRQLGANSLFIVPLAFSQTYAILSQTPCPPKVCKCCSYANAAEQKARKTYDNILRLSDDPDVNNVIRFLRQREIVHYQRFGECLRMVQEKQDQKNVYLYNPAFDKNRTAKG